MLEKPFDMPKIPLSLQQDEQYISFMEAYRLTGEAKIEGVKLFMDTMIDNGIKFLLFAHHMSVLDAYEKFCQKKKIEYIRIDGNVPLEKRHNRAKDF